MITDKTDPPLLGQHRLCTVTWYNIGDPLSAHGLDVDDIQAKEFGRLFQRR